MVDGLGNVLPEQPPVPVPRAPTIRIAVRVWVPWPLVLLVKVMVASYVLAASLSAFAFTANVTVVPDDAVPELNEWVSQVGTPDNEKPTLPLGALNV